MYDDSMELHAEDESSATETLPQPESIDNPIAGQQIAGIDRIVFPAVKNHNNYALDPYLHEADGSGESDLLLRTYGSGGGGGGGFISRMEPPLQTGTTSIHYPIDGVELPQPNGLNVRAEEIGLVLLVLLLWVGAVALFFNRWGKIRMLEPYQPKFIDVPRASLAVPLVGVTGTVPINVNGTPMMTNHHQQQARPSYPLIEYATINGAPSAVHQTRHQAQLLHHQLHHSSRLNMNNISTTAAGGGSSSTDPRCTSSTSAAVGEVQVEVCHHQQQSTGGGGSTDHCCCSGVGNNVVVPSSSSSMSYYRGRRASASPSANYSYCGTNLSPAPPPQPPSHPSGVLLASSNNISSASAGSCCAYCDCYSTTAATAHHYRQMTSRPRQNSVVVFATSHFTTAARRAKSAMDLQTLVLREETEENVQALAAAAVSAAASSATSSQQQSPLIGAITCV